MAARGYSASTSEREAARFSSELKKQVTRTTSDGSAPAAFTTCLRRASDFAVSGATGSSGPSEAAACAEKNTRPFGFTPRLPAATASRTTCAPASGRPPARPRLSARGGGRRPGRAPAAAPGVGRGGVGGGVERPPSPGAPAGRGPPAPSKRGKLATPFPGG